MTVRGAIRFARSFYRHWNQTLVDQILDHFEISGRRWIGRMSNGQRALVSLAIALAPDPELLILDDPTLGLDTVVRRDFLESMIQIIHRTGRTILMTSPHSHQAFGLVFVACLGVFGYIGYRDHRLWRLPSFAQ